MSNPPAKSTRLTTFAEKLRNHTSYVITGHINPDPDCLGTMLAVGWGLRQLGKQVTLVSSDAVPEGLRFLPGADEIGPAPAPKADALLVVDCEPERTGEIAKQLGDFTYVYNLDHHITNTATGPRAYVDPEAAATGEIALQLLVDEWGLTLDASAAFNLYVALMTDTGGFRFNNTTGATLRAAARLVEAGVQPGEAAETVYENMSWPAFLLLRSVLQSLTRSKDGRIAWITVTQHMLATCGATEDDSAGLAQYPRMIAGVDVSFLMRELEDGTTRVSLRSTGTFDVSVIAGRFGGGGHPGAAGCTIEGPPSTALPQLLDAAAELMRGGESTKG